MKPDIAGGECNELTQRGLGGVVIEGDTFNRGALAQERREATHACSLVLIDFSLKEGAGPCGVEVAQFLA